MGSRTGMRYFFGKRIVLGPEYHYLLASLCLIVFPTLFFVLTTALPASFALHWAPYIPTYIMAAAVLLFFFKACLTDPGIVPSIADESTTRKGLAFYQNIRCRGHTFTVKRCDTCNIVRPLRTAHCRTCNVCIAKHDHHCPWLGTCVGQHNYKYFIIFVLSVTIYCATIITMIFGTAVAGVAAAVYSVVQGRFLVAILYAVGFTLPPIPLLLVLAIFQASITTLLVQHIVLISRNETTHEHLRMALEGTSPYRTGKLANIVEFFRRAPPSYLRNQPSNDDMLDYSTVYITHDGPSPPTPAGSIKCLSVSALAASPYIVDPHVIFGDPDTDAEAECDALEREMDAKHTITPYLGVEIPLPDERSTQAELDGEVFYSESEASVASAMAFVVTQSIDVDDDGDGFDSSTFESVAASDD